MTTSNRQRANKEMKELRAAGSTFPVAVVPVTAYQFACQVSCLGKPVSEGGICFGVDPAKTAQALRELADRIERKEVLIESAKVSSLAHHEDFTNTTIELVLMERPSPKPLV